MPSPEASPCGPSFLWNGVEPHALDAKRQSAFFAALCFGCRAGRQCRRAGLGPVQTLFQLGARGGDEDRNLKDDACFLADGGALIFFMRLL